MRALTLADQALLARTSGGGAFNPFAYGTPTSGWWAEGPEMAALAPSDGATQQTWPDEIRTFDLTQATAGLRPTYDADGFSGKPSLVFAADWLQTAAWTNLGQPTSVAMLFRFTSTPSGNEVLFQGRSAAAVHAVIRLSGAFWIYGGAGTVTGGSTDNTAEHLLVAEYDGASSDLYVNNMTTPVATGNTGTNVLQGLTVGARYDGALTAPIQCPFIAVYDTPLDATGRGDLYTACKAHYPSLT